jgi:Asp-tRNA(Asn)/Glu-tRNA(Gln) amidotransferase A subunit family amidase
MAIADYAKYDALGLAELVAKKDVSAGELVEEAISRIERHNSKLNAVVFKTYDRARSTAKLPLSGRRVCRRARARRSFHRRRRRTTQRSCAGLRARG